MGENETESLKKVDKVNELIKKLSQKDSNDNEIFKEVDEFLSRVDGPKIGFDRTSINMTNKTENEEVKESSASFMKALEMDAKERAQRKAKARAKADRFKMKANDYFRACDFVKATDLYTKAIEACNDLDVLYTNRAQALIKLNMAQKALEDCDVALRLCPDNHKALLHRGRALVRLDRFQEAIVDYNKVLELAPNLKKYMLEFFDEAEKLQKKSSSMNASLSSMFQEISLEGSGTLELISEKLQKTGVQDGNYFVGGLRLLVDFVAKEPSCLLLLQRDAISSQGLFDPHCGLQAMLLSSTMPPAKDQVSEVSEYKWEALSLWMDLLDLLLKYVDDKDFAISSFKIPAFFDYVSFCTHSFDSLPPSTLLSVTAVLYRLSCFDLAVQYIFDSFPLHNVLGLLIRSMTIDKHQGLNVAGIGLFRNMADSTRFKIALGKEDRSLDSVINCLYTLLSSSLARDPDQLISVISLIDLLSDSSAVRLRLMKHDKFLHDCMNIVEARVPLAMDPKHADILLKLFTFIHNLLVLTKNIPTGSKIKSMGLRVVQSASALLARDHSVAMRSVLIQVLAQMLVLLNEDQLRSWSEHHSDSDRISRDGIGCDDDDDAVSLCRSFSRKSSLTDQNYLERVCKTLRLCIAIIDAPNHPLVSCAVKILTLASKVSQAVLFLCCDVRERTLKLQSILYKEKEPLDEVLAGNICLLFINSVNDTPLAEHLSNSSIMKDLLRVCADANKNDCRRNAAILAGKLAQSSHIHKKELSRLNGFNIISKFNSW